MLPILSPVSKLGARVRFVCHPPEIGSVHRYTLQYIFKMTWDKMPIQLQCLIIYVIARFPYCGFGIFINYHYPTTILCPEREFWKKLVKRCSRINNQLNHQKHCFRANLTEIRALNYQSNLFQNPLFSTYPLSPGKWLVGFICELLQFVNSIKCICCKQN